MRTAPVCHSPARGGSRVGPEPVPRGTCSRPKLGPAAFGVLLPQVRELGVPLLSSEAPHSPGSRAGPGAAAPCGHALFTRASALALPLVAVSACALPTTRSDSAKNNKSPPPAARRRLPSTDTASGIARRSASPPRPRDGHAPSDHAPVALASSRTKTTPSLAARRHHAPDGHASCCLSPWLLLDPSTCSCLIAELMTLSVSSTPGARSVLLSQGRG